VQPYPNLGALSSKFFIDQENFISFSIRDINPSLAAQEENELSFPVNAPLFSSPIGKEPLDGGAESAQQLNAGVWSTFAASNLMCRVENMSSPFRPRIQADSFGYYPPSHG
jgi:hypothetical protein